MECVSDNIIWKPSWELLMPSSLTRISDLSSFSDYIVVIMFNYSLEQLISFKVFLLTIINS